MVSSKFYNDYDEPEVSKSAWAEEGKIDTERLKHLEIEFLNAIQWKINVGESEFYERLKAIERLLAMNEGLSRGWFTYSELELLMPSLEIAKQILNYTTILMFSYACSIATIALSSVILASIPPTIHMAPHTNLTSAGMQTNLLPNAMISTEKLTFEDSLNLDVNFTINFPLLDHVMNWETRRNYQDITNFYLMPQKSEPVPICC